MGETLEPLELEVSIEEDLPKSVLFSTASIFYILSDDYKDGPPALLTGEGKSLRFIRESYGFECNQDMSSLFWSDEAKGEWGKSNRYPGFWAIINLYDLRRNSEIKSWWEGLEEQIDGFDGKSFDAMLFKIKESILGNGIQIDLNADELDKVLLYLRVIEEKLELQVFD